ncbi:3435_t:CDS:2 [Funneliformis geosporum]|uniref:3435_t:CDS:1 n=1 Tax=Funneliformis geosporum TaxID=1117311 RepID=A0A9W4X072_9GLOM|nr:3435_t:CDS:2 [Funneliformis geosporum]
MTSMVTRSLLPLPFLVLAIVNANAAVISNNTVLSSSTNGEILNDSIGNGIFFVAGIITSFANIVGCSTIMIVTFNTWKKSKKLSPTQKFPFYMSIMDLLIALITIPNLFYPMMNYELLSSGNLCQIIGFNMSLLITMNMILMTIVAIKTYLHICKRIIVNFGTYDWILFTSIFAFSLPFSIIIAVFEGYGKDNYWCYMNRMNNFSSKISMICLVILAYIVIMTTTFCYLKVIKTIHGVELMLASKLFKSEWCPIKRYRPSFMTNDDGFDLRPPSFFTTTVSIQSIPTASQQTIASNITRATRKITGSVAKTFVFLKNELFCDKVVVNQRNNIRSVNSITQCSFATTGSLTSLPKSLLTSIEEY